VGLFFLDSRLNTFSSIRSNLSIVTYPVQVVAALPSEISDWLTETFQNRTQLKARNAELETNNLLNSQRLQKLENLERENMRLRELLGSSFRLRDRVKVAEIVTVDLDPFSPQVVIDKGERDDVFTGQAVLDATGVMGQVVSMNPLSSHVILLTNPSHAIPVQLNRNGLRAIVTGRGVNELLQIDFLPHNADIRVGDLLVTSGLGGVFPVGYPVGTVTTVGFPQGKAFAEISVKPAAQIATSRDVLLVLNSNTVNASSGLITSDENINDGG